MWLLLCTSDDHPALWAADRLRARGLSPLVVLTPELLHFSLGWQHRLGNDDPPSVEFTLADGRVIHDGAVRGVLNRIATLSPHLVAHMAPEDRAYALQEWTALHISWLSAMQVPVLNLPVMQGLCGSWRHDSEWTWLAARAGLRTRPFRQDGACACAPPAPVADDESYRQTRALFVVNGQVVPADVDPGTAASCASLGCLSNTRLLGITLDAHDDTFVGASPRPDLTLGGEPLVVALHEALSSHA